ncbi:MAG TPA: GAF domain-containing SpoIIE family protein phosphatase [Tepidisphaeraceae bacterium]
MQTTPTSSPNVNGRQMRMILDVSRALAVPTDLGRLLCQIAEISCGLLGCERASIFLHDKSRGELWTKVALKSGEIRLPSNQGVVGHAFTKNQVVCVHDPYHDERFYRAADLQSGFVTRNLLSAPMKGLDGKPIGAIECVNKIGVPFGDADLALIELLADQAGVAVQRHQLQVEAVRAAALQREMDLARRAQEKLIPKSAPPVKGLNAVGWTLPASATGGDCFDLWQLPDGRLGVLLADASGHGLAPAMIVGQARSLVRAMSDLQGDPHAVLDRVNARLCDDLERNQFVTAFLGFLSSDGVLHWSSAGQAPILVRNSPAEPLVAIDAPTPPLGIDRAWNDPAPAPIALEPGGSLILVSDGLFEAVNRAGELFDVERMIATLDRWKAESPGEVLARLREAVRQWQGGREPLDDETIVVVQRDL